MQLEDKATRRVMAAERRLLTAKLKEDKRVATEQRRKNAQERKEAEERDKEARRMVRLQNEELRGKKSAKRAKM
ncbi:hypothetical protein PPTG_23910 [Phytophthora nicotianae INRA-310]|uniref:Uncharacterized protein n=2 Tax=Phytophthora nicotianae TaxID=4792 RepID=W2PRJ7_PHYN3|nr:hypothetical protein PPTG_23910 [Phytophthora nicotianae INRA-310]ETI37114.1 hypothetical protein F443_16854 [Phytophthora nicotianae P1569]ETN02635.1 hypothetical protein PPTG_23910 [Phytophthora nicotianae INRA-310]